jgi:methyltransferase family protein
MCTGHHSPPPNGTLTGMTQADWNSWHDAYDDPNSWQSRRLVRVRERIRLALDNAPPGPLTVLAMVAGQGRDLIPEIAAHPRRDDITARLVELDENNTDFARKLALEAGLTQVEVVTGDAALTDHYLGMAPADLVLICGLFVHIVDDDVRQVVRHARGLTKQGGTVIWTHSHGDRDTVSQTCDWFGEEGFDQLFRTGPEVEHAVLEHRSTREPVPLPAGVKLFTFVGIRKLRPWQYPDN